MAFHAGPLGLPTEGFPRGTLRLNARGASCDIPARSQQGREGISRVRHGSSATSHTPGITPCEAAGKLVTYIWEVLGYGLERAVVIRVEIIWMSFRMIRLAFYIRDSQEMGWRHEPPISEAIRGSGGIE